MNTIYGQVGLKLRTPLYKPIVHIIAKTAKCLFNFSYPGHDILASAIRVVLFLLDQAPQTHISLSVKSPGFRNKPLEGKKIRYFKK